MQTSTDTPHETHPPTNSRPDEISSAVNLQRVDKTFHHDVNLQQLQEHVESRVQTKSVLDKNRAVDESPKTTDLEPHSDHLDRLTTLRIEEKGPVFHATNLADVWGSAVPKAKEEPRFQTVKKMTQLPDSVTLPEEKALYLSSEAEGQVATAVLRKSLVTKRLSETDTKELLRDVRKAVADIQVAVYLKVPLHTKADTVPGWAAALCHDEESRRYESVKTIARIPSFVSLPEETAETVDPTTLRQVEKTALRKFLVLQSVMDPYSWEELRSVDSDRIAHPKAKIVTGSWKNALKIQDHSQRYKKVKQAVRIPSTIDLYGENSPSVSPKIVSQVEATVLRKSLVMRSLSDPGSMEPLRHIRFGPVHPRGRIVPGAWNNALKQESGRRYKKAKEMAKLPECIELLGEKSADLSPEELSQVETTVLRKSLVMQRLSDPSRMEPLRKVPVEPKAAKASLVTVSWGAALKKEKGCRYENARKMARLIPSVELHGEKSSGVTHEEMSNVETTVLRKSLVVQRLKDPATLESLRHIRFGPVHPRGRIVPGCWNNALKQEHGRRYKKAKEMARLPESIVLLGEKSNNLTPEAMSQVETTVLRKSLVMQSLADPSSLEPLRHFEAGNAPPKSTIVTGSWENVLRKEKGNRYEKAKEIARLPMSIELFGEHSSDITHMVMSSVETTVLRKSLVMQRLKDPATLESLRHIRFGPVHPRGRIVPGAWHNALKKEQGRRYKKAKLVARLPDFVEVFGEKSLGLTPKIINQVETTVLRKSLVMQRLSDPKSLEPLCDISAMLNYKGHKGLVHPKATCLPGAWENALEDLPAVFRAGVAANLPESVAKSIECSPKVTPRAVSQVEMTMLRKTLVLQELLEETTFGMPGVWEDVLEDLPAVIRAGSAADLPESVAKSIECSTVFTPRAMSQVEHTMHQKSVTLHELLEKTTFGIPGAWEDVLEDLPAVLKAGVAVDLPESVVLSMEWSTTVTPRAVSQVENTIIRKSMVVQELLKPCQS